LDGTARELLNEAEQAPNSDQHKKQKAEEVRAWLEDFLSGGATSKDKIEEAGALRGYSSDQLTRARVVLKLVVTWAGFPPCSTWSLRAF
jgi:hypothetical protein